MGTPDGVFPVLVLFLATTFVAGVVLDHGRSRGPQTRGPREVGGRR